MLKFKINTFELKLKTLKTKRITKVWSYPISIDATFLERPTVVSVGAFCARGGLTKKVFPSVVRSTKYMIPFIRHT